MAIAFRALRRFGLEPFRIEGTALPPNLLLMLKLVLVGLVLKGYHNSFPNTFAPFIPAMDYLPDPAFRRGLKLVFLVSATALLFNRAVRFNAAVIGCVFFVALLASMEYYRNAITFVAILFLLTALQTRGEAPRLLWWQLGIMYLGAGINKLLEPDWRSGHYFDYFLTSIFPSDVYATLAPFFPGKTLALGLCWWIIVAELAAGALFFVRRRHAAAVWFAVSVHAGAAFLVIGDYGIYLSALLASYLCVLQWPDHVEVSWRGGKPGALVNGSAYEGWPALWRWAVWSPATYFAGVIVLSIPYEPWRVIVVRGFGMVALLALCATLLFHLYFLFVKKRSGDTTKSPAARDNAGPVDATDARRVLVLCTLPPFTRNLVWAAGHAGFRCDVVTDTVHASWKNLSHVDRIVLVSRDRVEACDPTLLPEVFARFPAGYSAVLAPGDTRFTRLIHGVSSSLPGGITLFPQPEPALFEQLYDKGSFAVLLAELGLAHPKTCVVRSSVDVDDSNISWPVIVKAASSEGSAGYAPLGSRSELDQQLTCAGASEQSPALVQQFIPGDDIDMSLLADHGRIVAWTIQRRIRDDSMQFIEHSEVYRSCAQVVAATKYHGVIHFDLRIDSRDGTLYFIEANPRFWGSLCYSTWADVNFLELGMRLASGKRIDEPVRARTGTYPFLGVTRRTLPQLLLGGWPAPSRLSLEQCRYWRFYHRWGNGGLRSWFSQYLTGQKV